VISIINTAPSSIISKVVHVIVKLEQRLSEENKRDLWRCYFSIANAEANHMNGLKVYQYKTFSRREY
jgi:hypothetical protein